MIQLNERLLKAGPTDSLNTITPALDSEIKFLEKSWQK